MDVPSPLLRGLDLFSGIGGGSLALGGWVRPVAYCEIDPYCRGVLLSRMADGSLPVAPIWDNIRTLHGHMLPEIDIIYGGYPCTDLSDASHGAGAGLEGSESGLWFEMLRLVRECRPSHIFVENVGGAATRRWLPTVRRGLWELGYASLSLQLSASEVGAPFEGSRIFVAAAHGQGQPAESIDGEVARLRGLTGSGWTLWGQPSPTALGVADGVPRRMERLRAVGNAWCPAQAREAFRRLMGLP